MSFCGFFFLDTLFFLAPLVRPGFSGRAEGETIIYFFAGGGGGPPRAIARRRPPAAPRLRNPRGGALARVPGGAGRGGSAAAPGARPPLPPPPPRCRGSARSVRPWPRRWEMGTGLGTLQNGGRSLFVGSSLEHLLE